MCSCKSARLITDGDQVSQDPDGYAVFGRYPKGFLTWLLKRQLLGAGIRRDEVLHICFPATTPVWTRRGLLPIAEVADGDDALDGHGQWSRVIGTSRRLYSGDVLRIKATGRPELVCTPEHPILVGEWLMGWRDRWVAAGDVRAGHVLVAVAPQAEKIPEPQVVIRRTSTRPDRPSEHRVVPGPGLFRLLGYYLAEGYVHWMWTSARRVTKAPHAIHFAFAEHEQDFIADVSGLMSEHFGLAGRDRPSRGRTRVLSFNGRLAGEWFSQFGHRATGKGVPAWVLEAPRDWQAALLCGYLRGDGSRGSRGEVAWWSASRSLADAIRLMALRLGIVAGYSEREARPTQIGGRPTQRRRHFGGTVWGESARRLRQIIATGEMPDREAIRHTRWDGINKIVLGPSGESRHEVVAVTRESVTDAVVYNLTTAPGQTYTAHGVVVHNCSGTLTEKWTVDIRADARPAVQASGTALPFRDASFPAVLLDPPYSDAYARNLYGVENPRPSWLLTEAARVVVPGGRIGMMHVAIPFAPAGCWLVRVVPVSTGVGFRIRAFTIFERAQAGLFDEAELP